MVRSFAMRFLLAAFAMACVAGSGFTRAAQAPEGGSVRNVVLVHGAFADGSGWRGVYDDLTSRGYRVTIVQNPLTSLADDVAATKRALDRQDGPTVLVGHSWGGTVITEAGVHPNVAALVFVSAISPDAGESAGEQYNGFTTPPEFVLETLPDGFGIVKPDMFRAGFAADVSVEEAAFMAASQVPINMSAFSTRLTVAAWRSRPSWAVIATDDKAFDQRMLQHMAKRIGATVREVKASHAVFKTQAKFVAGVIDEAAKAAAARSR